jgi:hypothetical protein
MPVNNSNPVEKSMRTTRVAALVLTVLVAYMTDSVAAQQREKPPPKPKTDAKRDQNSAVPSPKFEVLSPDEGAAWAAVLDQSFDGFQVTAEQKRRETPKPKEASKPKDSAKELTKKPAKDFQKPQERSPTGRLCVIKRGEPVPDTCTYVAPEIAISQEFSDLNQLITKLDSKNFKGVKAETSYIVQMKGGEQISSKIATFFARLTAGLNLSAVSSGNFLVLIPRMDGKRNQSGVAAAIKQDLEGLNEAYVGAKNSKEKPETAEKCKPAPDSDDCTRAILAMERWMATYTVRFSYLAPRDVVLALSGVGDPIQARTQGLAITILPSRDVHDNGAYLVADAIERDALYQLKRNEAKQAALKKDGGSRDKPDASDSEADKVQSKSNAASDDGSAKGNGTGGSEDSAKAGGKDSGSGGGKDASASAPAGDEPLEFDNVVRLFHLRRAKDIAAAINKASKADSPLVAILENNPQDDLLMILPAAGEHKMDIKRAIAMLDQPRPQLSLQVWHYQLSTKTKQTERPFWAMFGGGADEHRLQEGYEKFRDVVLGANRRMTMALERGYAAALDYAAERKPTSGPSDLFNPVFREYLTGKYEDCLKADHYCLGFYDAFDVADSERTQEQRAIGASLSRLLLLLAASKDGEVEGLVQSITNEMDEGPDCETTEAGPVCLEFSDFGERLGRLAEARNLHVLQAALLDFLFQYRWTVVYPDDFVPYDLQRTAHALDDLLHPVVEAFNRDLDTYVEKLFKEKVREQKKLNGLVNRGQIQVATLSGSGASVQGQVKNYFDITPPMSLNDILNTGSQANIATALKGALEPKEVLILQALANIGTQPRITAELSENASLKITPISLDTASSAELDVDFDVGEPTAPVTSGVSSSPKDLLDRVSDHHVTTHVRVESLKLFQISSFTMTLTHPQRGTLVPVIGWGWEAIFGTIPYVGNLFRLPPYSATVDNRSLAVVRAVVGNGHRTRYAIRR